MFPLEQIQFAADEHVPLTTTQDMLGIPKARHGYLFIKRAFDFFSSLALTVVVSPLILIIAIAIKLDSKGPIFFVHKRVGKNGTPIGLYKFRSMVVDAESMIKQFTPEQMAEWKSNFKLSNDPRITRVGKFLRRTSLDELPQLLNIIQGNLSVIGPRPIIHDELSMYGDKIETFLSAKPGLIGYWQINGRTIVTYDERVEMEIHYVQNAGLWTDAKILFRTLKKLFRLRGV